MLKLEKIAKTNEIGIVLQHKEAFFSSSLLKAFILALGLHLLAALFFQVHPLKVIGSQMILPPILVEADLSSPIERTIAAASLDQEETFSHLIGEPKGTILSTPRWPENHFTHFFEWPSLVETRHDLFANRSDETFGTDLMIPSKAGKSEKNLRIYLSGPLAEKKRIENELKTNPCIGENSWQTRYAVRLDNRTGTIFWHQALEESPLCEKEAEAILASLRFQPDLEEFVTWGIVDIAYLEGRQGD
jgi:hypothetical protein